jgi:negative modulator of initiation of replication
VKTIDVDDDIYRFIANHTERIGESASDILRRLLKLTPPPAQPDSELAPATATAQELQSLLESPDFKFLQPLDKFLAILGWAYEQKSEEFEKVLSIQGRDRLYFAKSEQEITRSGRSTQPKQIPGSPYWVMTNSPTRQKADLIRKVLRLLGFSSACAEAGGRSLQGNFHF